MRITSPRGRLQSRPPISSAKDEGAFELGTRAISELASLSLTLPISIIGSLSQSLGATAQSSTQQPTDPVPSDQEPTPGLPPIPPRISFVGPLIALSNSLLRMFDTVGRLTGGRAGTAGFQGPRPGDPGQPDGGPVSLLLLPVSTLIYLLRDVAESYRRGVERATRRLRQRGR